MDDLEKSLTYVPTYQVVEQIRKEEKAIARDVVKTAKDLAKAAKNETKKERQQKEALVLALWQKEVSIEQIAIIMDTTSRLVENIVNKKKNEIS